MINILSVVRQKLFILLLMISATQLLSGCNEQPDAPINLAGNNWLGYQPLFAAHEIGISQHNPNIQNHHSDKLSEVSHFFSMTTLPSTTSVMRMISNQQLDGAMLTLDEAIQFIDKSGINLCIVLVMDYSNGADALAINPQSFNKESQNKIKIGYESTALGGYMLYRAAEVLKLDINHIKPIIVQPREHVKAYQTGKVDGIISFEPFLSQIQKIGGKIQFSSQDIPNEIIDVLVVKSDLWQQRKKNFDELINVIWKRGLSLLENKDPRVIDYIQSFTELSPDDLSKSYAKIHLVTPEENQVLLAGKINQSIKNMSNYLLQSGKISKNSGLSRCR